jgi:hypothetical protein
MHQACDVLLLIRCCLVAGCSTQLIAPVARPYGSPVQVMLLKA